jgi:hypothetical protein
MNCNFPRLLTLSAFTLINCNISAYSSQFTSDIFTYDNPTLATGLHACLQGDGWQGEDIKESHIKFHQDLFGNPFVMQGFADGQIREAEGVKSRCLMSINDRFAKGFPHGLLTLSDPETGTPFMHIIGGGGDRAGTSEIAYAMLPEYQGKKFGTKVVSSFVQEWAPEVRRIGLGNGLDPITDEKIIKAFQCYEGKALDQLDATASPSNVTSWRILDGLSFQAAVNGLESSESLIDFDGKELGYAQMEAKLLELFDSQYTSSPLKSGQRYRMIDINAKVRTFSKHATWDRIKYHFEMKMN